MRRRTLMPMVGLFGEAGNDDLIGGPGFEKADGGPGNDGCSAEQMRSCERAPA